MPQVTAPPVTVVKVSPAPDTSIYADDDLVGALLTIPNAPKSGILHTVILADANAQAAALDLYLFGSLPTSTFTNNAALALSDADANKIIGIVRIAAADYATLPSQNATAVKANLGLAYALDANTLYACLVSNGATPTYAAGVSALQLAMAFIPDN